MSVVIWMVLLVLLAGLGIGLVRIAGATDTIDRFLSIQLMGTIAVAIVLLLAVLEAVSADGGASHLTSGLIDVALVFAALSVVTVGSFVQRAWRVSGEGKGGK